MNTSIPAWLLNPIEAIVLIGVVAHAFKFIATRIEAHAKTTETKRDDEFAAKLVYVAGWFDAVATALAHAVSLGFFAKREQKPK